MMQRARDRRRRIPRIDAGAGTARARLFASPWSTTSCTARTAWPPCCYHPSFSLVRGDVRSMDDDAAARQGRRHHHSAGGAGRGAALRSGSDRRHLDQQAGDRRHARRSSAAISASSCRSPTAATASARPASSAPRRRRSGRCRSTAATRSRSNESLLERHPAAISLRLATVFGMSPRMRLDLLVNDFTYRAYTDRFIVLFESHFKRNFIHVRDVARAFLHAHRRLRGDEGQIYNVGLSDANLSKLRAVRADPAAPADVRRSTSPNVGKDPDKRDYIVSNEKIERTGYQAGVLARRRHSRSWSRGSR